MVFQKLVNFSGSWLRLDFITNYERFVDNPGGITLMMALH